ncbi:putative transcription factor bHLH family [Rosa chinensis]|uniref:Putative transcription factor bHLH family n=1 Tax=Rosa chinensis TaxID=74649 RepID=A0A2P6S6N2_ROSCH|nr:transcription factor ICE1 [Rosa chinensis]PRQ54343.1 putative transcription factor bHLH family [Rosa chinensis]
MLPMSSGGVWMNREGEDAVSSWTSNPHNNNETEPKDLTLASFKAMLEGDWYLNNNNNNNVVVLNQDNINCFSSNPFQMDTSASCSPSMAFTLLNSNPNPNSKSCFSSLRNSNPFDNNFNLVGESELLTQLQQQNEALMNLAALNPHSQVAATPALSSGTEFPSNQLLPASGNTAGVFSNAGFESSGSALLLNRAEDMSFPCSMGGAQPTLYQKRAALRQNSTGSSGCDILGNLEISGPSYSGLGLEEKRKRRHNESEMEDDMSSLNFYDSDGQAEEEEEGNVNNAAGGGYSNANSSVTDGDFKGKKTGLPAKNLMAERRRRKKLNDRLYMLRSVVPKISKMDRASILGDAIDYLRELLGRIDDLHKELESDAPGSSLQPSTNFNPLTPNSLTYPGRIKEELRPSSLPTPKSQQPAAKVDVQIREGRALNIRMLSPRRPGLLLSTMRALDNLGLDIQQAVISCFNGFALDVFQAQQSRESHFLPEQIRAVLLKSAGFDGMM